MHGFGALALALVAVWAAPALPGAMAVAAPTQESALAPAPTELSGEAGEIWSAAEADAAEEPEEAEEAEEAGMELVELVELALQMQLSDSTTATDSSTDSSTDSTTSHSSTSCADCPAPAPKNISAHPFGSGDYLQLQWFARLAALGYCARPHHQRRLMDARACPAEACAHAAFDSLQVLRVFEFPGLLEVGSGFIGVDHAARALYLVYKGSASTRDWVKNLNAIPVPYEPVVHTRAEFAPKTAFRCRGCRIHKGFGTFTKTNGATILRAVLHYTAKYPAYRVVVAGHSLGGALALISAAELRLMGLPVLAVTLGAPRVGNRRFVRFVDALFDTAAAVAHIAQHRSFAELPTALVRMVHRHDLVPMLPPTRLYRHAGYEYFLAAAGVAQCEGTVRRGALDYNDDARRELGRRPPRDYSTIDHVGYFYRVSTCRGEGK